jgi:transposase
MSNRGQKLRKFDEEFKRRSVQLYLTSGKSCEKLGKELGISTNTLYSWVKHPRYASGTTPAGQSNGENSEQLIKEFKALKRELSIVREERDILKKALAIFSEDVPKN